MSFHYFLACVQLMLGHTDMLTVKKNETEHLVDKMLHVKKNGG